MRLRSACERPTSVKNLHFLFRKARCAISGGIRVRKSAPSWALGAQGSFVPSAQGAFVPSVHGVFAPRADDAFGKLCWPTAGSFAFEQRGAEARWEGPFMRLSAQSALSPENGKGHYA